MDTVARQPALDVNLESPARFVPRATLPADLALDPALTRVDQLVYLTYADHMDRHGRCWPSRGRIAKLAGIGLARLKRSLAVLTAAGWLIRFRAGRFTNRWITMVCRTPHVPWRRRAVSTGLPPTAHPDPEEMSRLGNCGPELEEGRAPARAPRRSRFGSTPRRPRRPDASNPASPAGQPAQDGPAAPGAHRRCARHAAGDPGRPCRACGRARQAADAADTARREQDRARTRAEHAQLHDGMRDAARDAYRPPAGTLREMMARHRTGKRE